MKCYLWKNISVYGAEKLEISGIQDVRLKYKQNWINHLERMDNTRLPKHALNYKPRGRRDRERPRKRWQYVDAGTGQTTWKMMMMMMMMMMMIMMVLKFGHLGK